MSGVKSACVFVIWLAGWVMFIGTFLVLLFCLFLVSSVWSGCVIRRGGCIGVSVCALGLSQCPPIAQPKRFHYRQTFSNLTESDAWLFGGKCRLK